MVLSFDGSIVLWFKDCRFMRKKNIFIQTNRTIKPSNDKTIEP
jgi:hypothetical protein